MADEQYPFGEAGSNDGLNEQGNTSDGAFDAQWYASQEPQASQDTGQAQPTNQMGAHYAQPGTQSSYQGSSYPYQDDAQAYQGTSQTPPQPTQTQPQVWSYGYGQQGAQSSYGYEQQNNWQQQFDAGRKDRADDVAFRDAVFTNMRASVAEEPGVLAMYAVTLADDPTTWYFWEVYASEESYAAHRETAHFKTYIAATADLVSDKELTPLVPDTLVNQGGLSWQA